MPRLTLPRWRRAPARPALSTHGAWSDSTVEVTRWIQSRAAGRRAAVAGGVVGALAGLVAFAPAAWLAGALTAASGERLVLADARGSVWSGDAVVVLTGGPGSRDARALPGRLAWRLGLSGAGLRLEARQACCINETLSVDLRPGLGRLQVVVNGAPGWAAQWPAAWLAGLGTPFNTLDLGGAIRLDTQGLRLEWLQGRWRVDGGATLELRDVSSRVSTLPRLGSYRLDVRGAEGGDGTARVELSTLDGALQLSGQGSLGPAGLRLRGEARAAEAQQSALNNLLNIIGRRDGARSVLSIG
jgi:general secretion pathway protein N